MAKHPVPRTDSAVESANRPDPEVVALVQRCITVPGTLLPERDAEATSREIAARIMAATTEEELDAVLAARLHPVTGTKDGELPPLTGMPLRIHAIGFNNGDETYAQDERIRIYAVIDAETQDGRRILASCGGESVVAYLVKRWSEGWLPVDVVISPSDKPTRSGYRPLNIRRADFKAETPF